jgi:hypothetical protein
MLCAFLNCLLIPRIGVAAFAEEDMQMVFDSLGVATIAHT